jgi:type VI secretion system protein ImpG
VLPPSSVKQLGFEDDEALLPYGARSFQGYRLLQEYFTLPQRFMFVRVSGLASALGKCPGDSADLTLLLHHQDVRLEKALSAENFALFCTPAVNLFKKRLDRIHLDDRFSEFHVVPDRTAPLDYEVHSINQVTGYGGRGQGQEQVFRPFYRAKDGDTGESECYYALHRVPRMLSERERLGRHLRHSTTYTGSEVYLSLVDANAAPYRTDLKQIGIEAMCTNRDLPIQLPVGQEETDFNLDIGAPIESVRCLRRPTSPWHSRVHGEFAWRLISHLTTNHLSVVDTDGGDRAASSLREILDLYNPAERSEIRKQIDGVRAVTSRPVVRRIGTGGPTSFARGLEISVTMDETAFKGTGIFLLGAVLERFFAKYVTINVFTTTMLNSLQRGEVKQWPVRIGLTQNL